MIVLQIIIGVIAAVGVGFLLADLMKIPSLKASKAANSVGRKGKKLSMALMMCFLLIYIAVIGQVLMNSLGGIM